MTVCLYISFLDITSLCFPSLVPCYLTSPEKQVTNVLKDSDTESENLSLLIRLFVSDGQKIDCSKDVSFIGIK